MPVKRAIAVVLGSGLLNAAFFETALYYALLHRQPRITFGDVSLQVVSASLIGWLLLLVALLLDRRQLRTLLERIKAWLDEVSRVAREAASLLLFLIPILFLLFLVLQGPLGRRFRDLGDDKVLEGAALAVVMAMVCLLSWFVTWIIRTFKKSTGRDLEAALDAWSWSIRLSTVYYVFVAGCAWNLIRPSTVAPQVRLVAHFSLVKDLFLMWIIAELLFASLFKLREAQQLRSVFASVRGYLQFILVCAVIAVVAIAADFYYLVSSQAATLYPDRWQQDLMEIHTFTRDLGLLLLPISGLLVWTLRGLAEELKHRGGRSST